MFSDVIYIGQVVETVTLGEITRSVTWTKKYCQKMAVKRAEFYSAENVGLKPEAVFRIRSCDFSNEEKVRYNNVDYSIIRAYQGVEYTELTCATTMGQLNG